MSEQDRTQPTAKQRSRRRTNKQNSTQVSALQRPTNEDTVDWKAYWQAQGQPWRTEPEIDPERQKYLDERRAIVPDIEKGIYPFKGIKLSRADVEWLLATHENGKGPVDWGDQKQRIRMGIDVRGADLRQLDLHHLPLARLRGSLLWDEWLQANDEQRDMAAVLMDDTNLSDVELNRAFLRRAKLKNTNLFRAQLSEAYLREAHLEGADFSRAQLEGAYLLRAYLSGAKLQGAHFEGADLFNVTLHDQQHIGPRLADADWGDVNLAVVNWSEISKLGDEFEALQRKENSGKPKSTTQRLQNCLKAVRANRQLAVALRSQGLDEDGARFAYRGQKLQRVVLRLQQKYIQYFFSLLLDLLAGYGYRPIRTLLWYIFVVASFATAYTLFGHLQLLPDALVFSLTSFHGRGFFPGLGSETTLHNPLVVLAAVEAVVGLFIEISFIATFTQRFFGK